MIIMNSFERYKKLKSQYDFVYKGIHLNRVLSFDLWLLANSKKAGFWFISLLKVFLAKDITKIEYNDNILTTFGDKSRTEYLKLYDNILSKIGSIASRNDMSKVGNRLSFSTSSFSYFVKSLRLLNVTDLTFWQKCRLAVHTVYYCNTIDLLEKQPWSPKKYLCMCHVLGIDNLLTQYFKQKNIPTYSLQEGIYFLFGENPPLDSILYENFETDNLLCWGQYTADEYQKYGIDKHRFRISGYPKELSSFDVVVKNPLRKCLVLLARESFNNSNIKLIELLSGFTDDYDFYLKIHPSCNYSLYKRIAEEKGLFMVPTEMTIGECLNNKEFDFSVAVNTTVYYEALMKGLPCFRYHDDSFVLMAGLDDVFENREQFRALVFSLEEASVNEYQQQIRDMLEYAIGYGLDNYVEEINS